VTNGQKIVEHVPEKQKIGLDVTPVMMKPIDSLKLRGLVHSLNEKSGSDFNFRGLNMTAEQENVACIEALDLAVKLGIITSAERQQINEKGKDPLTEEQRRNFISVLIAVVGVGKGNAGKMFSVVKGLESQTDVSAAILNPTDGSSYVVEQLGRTIQLSEPEALLWRWALGVVQSGGDLATAKRNRKPELKKPEVKQVRKESNLEDIVSSLGQVKPRGLENIQIKEKLPKFKKEPTVETEVKTVEGRKPAVTEGIVSSLGQVKPRGLENIPIKERAPKVEEKKVIVKKEEKPPKVEEPEVKTVERKEKIRQPPVEIDMRRKEGQFFEEVQGQTGELPDYRKEHDLALENFRKRTLRVKEKKKDDVPKVKDDIKPVVKKETLEVKAIEPPKVVKYEPPTAVLEEKPKVTVPEKTAEKETVFSKYPEFEGKELSSGITWIDALWSDADFIRMYGTLSINPNERKDAVGKFVEDAEGMKDLYESMGSQDIGKNRERLMKILVSFKEE